MYNCPVRWHTVVDEMSVGEMSVDELSWNWTNWYGQNVTEKMVAISIDFNSIELNIYLVTTSYK